MKAKMPIKVYMLFAYFAGIFATIEKTNWYDWLLPFVPLLMLIPLQLIWNYKPIQRTLKDY